MKKKRQLATGRCHPCLEVVEAQTEWPLGKCKFLLNPIGRNISIAGQLMPLVVFQALSKLTVGRDSVNRLIWEPEKEDWLTD